MFEYTKRQWVELIYESIMDELADAAYYRRLAREAPNYEAREIIQSMADDEARHARRLTEVYQSMTGRIPEPMPPQPLVGHYCQALSYRFHEETGAYRKYKEYYLAAGHGKLRDVFFDIMHDEALHAMNILYLMQQHCCGKIVEPHEKEEQGKKWGPGWDQGCSPDHGEKHGWDPSYGEKHDEEYGWGKGGGDKYHWDWPYGPGSGEKPGYPGYDPGHGDKPGSGCGPGYGHEHEPQHEHKPEHEPKKPVEEEKKTEEHCPEKDKKGDKEHPSKPKEGYQPPSYQYPS